MPAVDGRRPAAAGQVAVQSSETSSAPDLLVTLDVCEPVVAGLSVIARIRVINRGKVPLATSARLNLMEGDLALIVQGPDGQTRTIKGWQADTALRRTTLEPGEEIVNGINLLSTDADRVFPASGRYELTAEFTFSPQQRAMRSDPVVVSARLPESDDEREVARMLLDEALRDAILLAKPASAPEALRTLATRFATTPDGMLAALLVSAGDAGETPAMPAADAGPPATPEWLALAVAMLQTPFSHVGRQIADRFTADLETGTARRDDTTLPDTLAMTAQIAKRLPFKRK
jgi:CheY-like chemotaxis protein